MLRSAWNNFRKWGSNYRILVILLSVLVFTFIRTDYIRSYAQEQGLSVTPYFFAFQFDDGITRMLFYFGLVLLFCNAPFTDAHQMFVLIRIGRRRWFAGQILYIFLATLCYFFVIAAVGALIFVPRLGFSTDWGSVFRICAEDNMLVGVYMHKEIIEHYTPITACLLTYIMNVGVGLLLGLVIFYGNMFRSRIFGPAVAGAWIVFSNMVDNLYLPLSMQYISPLHWTTLYSIQRNVKPISVWYIVTFEVVGYILFIGLIMNKSKKYAIEALEEI